jgi:hypothetical protein
MNGGYMATKRRKVQIQLTVDPKDLAAFDKLVAKRGGNRSLAISKLMRQEIDASHLASDTISRMNQPVEQMEVAA